VYNRQTASRYSMPFFLGFNPEAICEVVPTCVDEEHPALYPPISAGQVSGILECVVDGFITDFFDSGIRID
jgi:isopenicillin N synthase-like dioxygenase